MTIHNKENSIFDVYQSNGGGMDNYIILYLKIINVKHYLELHFLCRMLQVKTHHAPLGTVDISIRCVSYFFIEKNEIDKANKFIKAPGATSIYEAKLWWT